MIRIAFLGDIAVLEEKRLRDGSEYFRNVSDYLGSFDYVIANLEVAVTPRTSTMTPKSMHLRTDERILEIVKQLQVSCVVLSNNHVGDYDRKGIEDTIAALKKVGIPFVGVDGAKWHIENGETKLSLTGYCCYSANGSQYAKKYSGKGVSALTKQSVMEQLEMEKKAGYFSIFSFHWGDEFSNYPNHKQLAFARELMSQDNVMIYGHHTHVMSGYEKMGNALTAYSLGNFYFDRCVSPKVKNFSVEQTAENRESYILEVTFEGNTITDICTTGISGDEDEFRFIDNREKVNSISDIIVNEIGNTEKYQSIRLEQIHTLKEKKFAKHDFKWFMSKMNYYSIMSHLIMYLNKYRYNHAF